MCFKDKTVIIMDLFETIDIFGKFGEFHELENKILLFCLDIHEILSKINVISSNKPNTEIFFSSVGCGERALGFDLNFLSFFFLFLFSFFLLFRLFLPYIRCICIHSVIAE